ncbi:Tripartite motif-containing protein 35 [Anabarilius grahami]|uniref:Tripartite motif-containing protein 35 n=1 Tax=Anabarilius grahami TaxID=495550 RepID=A0A3N0YRW7_ANAGA|nr:Tripartite motif-containing protein 35 [Anabarilius grahami]
MQKNESKDTDLPNPPPSTHLPSVQTPQVNHTSTSPPAPKACGVQVKDGPVIKVGNLNTYVIGSYMDYRFGEKQIKTIAIIRRVEQVEYSCVMCCEGRNVTSPAEYTIHSDHFGFEYGTATITCHINSPCLIPTHVAITAREHISESITSFLPVRNRDVPAVFPYEFTICISVMYDYNNVLNLVESMEMFRLLGAQRVVIYKTSCDSDTQKVLDYYVKRGFVEIIPWTIKEHINVSSGWRKDLSPGQLHYYGQIPALNDCIYRYMYQSHYVALHDMAELILPLKRLSLATISSISPSFVSPVHPIYFLLETVTIILTKNDEVCATIRLLSHPQSPAPVDLEDSESEFSVVMDSHSLCKECIQQFWRIKKTQECPVCRRRSSREEPPYNLALKNLCELFLKERNERHSSGSEEICSLHSEKLKLFCLEDKQPMCVVCFTSQQHDNHKCRPISEVVSSYKEELNTALKSLEKKLQHKEKMKAGFEKTVQHIKSQAEHTERQIKQQFEKLHQFLRDEEEAAITALREEEEQKKQMMKEKLEEMNRHISALSHTIKDMEEMMKASDVCFLKEFPVSKERVQISRPDPQMASGALIHVSSYLGNLPFKVWKKMQDIVQNKERAQTVLEGAVCVFGRLLSASPYWDALFSFRHSSRGKSCPHLRLMILAPFVLRHNGGCNHRARSERSSGCGCGAAVFVGRAFRRAAAAVRAR